MVLLLLLLLVCLSLLERLSAQEITLIDRTTPWQSTVLAAPSSVPEWHLLTASNLSSSPYSWSATSMPLRSRSAVSFSGAALKAYFLAEFSVPSSVAIAPTDAFLLQISCVAANSTSAALAPCLLASRLSINAVTPFVDASNVTSTVLDSTSSTVAVSAVPLPRAALRAVSVVNQIVVESDVPALPGMYYMFISLSIVSANSTAAVTSTTTVVAPTTLSPSSSSTTTTTTSSTTTATTTLTTTTTNIANSTVTSTTPRPPTTHVATGSTTTEDLFDGLSFSFESDTTTAGSMTAGSFAPTTTRTVGTLPERPPSTTSLAPTTTTNATLSWFDAAVRDDLGAVVGVIVAVSVCYLFVAGVGGFFLYRYIKVARSRSERREDELAYHDADSF